ncbi:MAG: hypothetical protein JO327_06855 [Nitrososphaeraceae archaeon]|nr:hypothetical protein [Nitrososphaeraceae archaeon]MBV9667835.1 hypothetical protein [Nitrososphaeraceae archaeon]
MSSSNEEETNNTITLKLSYEESAILEWALIKVMELIDNGQLPDDLYGGEQTRELVSRLIDKIKKDILLLNSRATTTTD